MPAPAEILLAQIWNAQWLAAPLTLSDGRALRVVYRGVWTHGFGPDFTGAALDLGGQLVHGDVEIHRRAADWPAHDHQLDPRYNRVLLHVVLDDDLSEPVRRQDGRRVATLVLRHHLPGPLADFPLDPALRSLGAIGFEHCAPEVAAHRPDAIQRVWEAAGDARLDGKVRAIAARLALEPPAQVLYALLLDALGYARNRDGMRALAGLLPYDHLDAHLAGRGATERWEHAAALLIGVGGFLPLSPGEAATAALSPVVLGRIEAAWQAQGAPWREQRLPASNWTLARIRPAAHPLRRLLALAVLLARLDVGLVEDLCTLVALPDAPRALRRWLTESNPYLGEAHGHEIVVNVVVPFALAYGEESGDDALVERAAGLWARLPAGRGNADVRRTAEQICGPHPVPVRSARAEQGLLHIRRTGCAALRCYECPVARLALSFDLEREPGETPGSVAGAASM